jgi:hypothetical protein
MRIVFISLLLLSSALHADLKWDIPITETSRIDGRKYVMDLKPGESGLIETDASYCTTDNNILAIDGLSLVGEGDVTVKITKAGKAVLIVDDAEEFLSDLALTESFSRCDVWTSHKGKYIVVVDSINGKNSISELIKSENPIKKVISEMLK